MSDAAIDAETRVRELMIITRDLSAIFAKENELLETRRPREIAPLQTEKARLAAAYAQAIRDAAKNRAAFSAAEPGLLSELRDITAGFEERAARQRALLDGARQASEGVVKAIAEEAAAQNPDGAYSSYPKSADAAPVSINENA
ncbi:MAG: hypothetical protein AAFW81_01930 [Pseudomonadota bacterium]